MHLVVYFLVCNHLEEDDFLLSHPCLVIVYVLWLFLTVPLVGVQCVKEVFSDHTRVLLDFTNN